MPYLILFVVVCLLSVASSPAQNRPCEFDPSTLLFKGSPLAQARCLLRTNSIGGVLSNDPAAIPPPLDSLIGKPFKYKRSKVRTAMSADGVKETDLGGNLDEALAIAHTPDGKKVASLYFVIHDTSWPYLKDEAFPANFNYDTDWRGNDLSIWNRTPVAHVFVDRLGRSSMVSPFSEPVLKGWGTKFARDVLKNDAKSLQIHIELIQPRRRDPLGSPNNDRIAPQPGFSPLQYRTLAWLYIAASCRRGNWLIPAFHAAVDAGIKDAHDDPQNFELTKFAQAVEEIIGRLK